MRVMYLKSEIARQSPGDGYSLQFEMSNSQFEMHSSGEGGIRTHGGHRAHNGFRDRPNRPLWHLSNMSSSRKPRSDGTIIA